MFLRKYKVHQFRFPENNFPVVFSFTTCPVVQSVSYSDLILARSWTANHQFSTLSNRQSALLDPLILRFYPFCYI
uniref:Uncharacterized protein n=1 Tax=Caenorhabditis japonica TaxID=281687 RepID=A0A8R1EHG7_CAEJA